MDILSKEERSKRMRSIKSKGSKEEILLAKALWHTGLRYRKNNKSVFGKPDFTFKKFRIAIFVDSEFFHGKNWEVYKHRVKESNHFWIAKIERNIERDREVNAFLIANGWTVLRFWSTEVKKNLEGCVAAVQDAIALKQANT